MISRVQQSIAGRAAGPPRRACSKRSGSWRAQRRTDCCAQRRRVGNCSDFEWGLLGRHEGTGRKKYRRDYARFVELNRYRRSLHALVTTASATAAIATLSGVAGVISTRSLGPYERGVLATAVVWTSILGSLVVVGLPQAVTYFVAREPASAPHYAGSALLLGAMGGTVLGLIGAGFALMLVDSSAAVPMAVLFAVMAPAIVGGLTIAAVLGQRNYRDWSILRLLHPAFTLAGVLAVVSTGAASALTIACVTAAAATLQTAAALLWARRHGLLGRPSRAAARDLLSYGWRQLVAGAAWLTTYKLDQAVLSIAVVPTALGLYAVAASVGEVIAPVAASAGSVMLARVAAGGRRAVGDSLVLSLLFCVAISGSLSLVAFFSADQLLSKLFGEGFRPAATEMRILLVGGVALAVATVLADTLRGLGRPLVPARAELGGAVAAAGLLALLVPTFGIQGAAVASTLSYSLVMVLMALGLRATMKELSTSGEAERASGDSPEV